MRTKSNLQRLIKRAIIGFVVIQLVALVLLGALLGQQKSEHSTWLPRRLQTRDSELCYWGNHYYCQSYQRSSKQGDWSGDDYWNDDGGWHHYDDFWHDDTTGDGDDWTLATYQDDIHYDDQYWYDDYTADQDDYVFEYKPVLPSSIINTHGGYGGRRGRALHEIRFNKCPPLLDGYSTTQWRYGPSQDYIKGVHRGIFPLMPADYPPHGEKGKILRRETMASSVMTAGDWQLHGATADQYGYKLGDPVFPGANADNRYWDELRHVVDVQKARRNKAEPNSINRWPDLWQGYDLDEIAQLVHDEYPASLQQSMLYGLFKEGVKLNYDIIPFRSVVDFVATEVRMAKLNTWVVDTVAPISFMMKWHEGVPRPEEVAWLIYSGAFTGKDGVPADLQNSIRNMKLEHATNFTAYPEGSPTHPSWPAMHSAASTLSFWLPVVVKLTPAQYCEALRVDYAVSYARTVAGVHYLQDNYAGLNLGMEVMLEKFPDMMYERYGADPDAVRSRMEYLKFDWHAFDSYDCTIGGVPAAQWLGEMAA